MTHGCVQSLFKEYKSQRKRISKINKRHRRKLWSFVFRSFGVDWVISGCVLDHVAVWRNWFGKHSSAVWNLVPSCVMWSLWRERNNRTFEDLEHSVASLLSFV